MKEEGELTVELRTFLASELDGGEGSASHPGITPASPTPNTKKKKFKIFQDCYLTQCRKIF
jgi:hypothetical protein